MCEGGSDTGSNQRADGEPEGDRKEDVANADHGGGSLDVAKMGGIDADAAQECSED